MENAKRKLRTYKTLDHIYDKAMIKADMNKIALSKAIEKFLVALGKAKSDTITINLKEK